MVKLVGQIEIFSKTWDFTIPNPVVFALFIIFTFMITSLHFSAIFAFLQLYALFASFAPLVAKPYRSNGILGEI